MNLALVKKRKSAAAVDIFALAVVYLVPVFSHLTGVPFYYIEPMRIALVFSLLFAGERNSYAIAATLPLFSHLFSGHPVLPKALLISAELSFNAYLFYYLNEKFGDSTAAFLSAVVGSKIFYYAVKFLLIQTAVLSMPLVSAPLAIQSGAVVLFALLFDILNGRKEKAK